MFAKIEPGRRVRVKSGLFEGVEGTVLAKRGEGRSVIAVDLIQKSVTLEIDNRELAAIGFNWRAKNW
jgi:transcription antitermination factor NusG